MGLWRAETDATVARAAALAYQLPHDGRVYSAIAPAGAHGMDVLLLRQIELNQRTWHWAHSEQAKDESTRPEPIMLEGEQEAIDRRVGEQVDAAFDIAEQLGLSF